MKPKVILPQKVKPCSRVVNKVKVSQSHYKTHIRYVLNSFESFSSSFNIQYQKPWEFGKDIVSGLTFCIKYNDKFILFDFSDHYPLRFNDKQIDQYDLIFKYHFKPQHKEISPKIHPYSPISFLDWGVFENLKNKIKYDPSKKTLISNRQRILDNITPWREKVRTNLQRIESENKDLKICTEMNLKQEEYFMEINELLAPVFVGGARAKMLDRAQFQYMAFGCCTISPEIPTILCYNKTLEPFKHYIPFDIDDETDLYDKIRWVKENPTKSRMIGENAKRLVMQTSTPSKQIGWIKQCLQ